MSNRIRYNIHEVQRNLFYQFPKFLLLDEEFKGLSNDARILYMVLKDRHELSIKNKWVDGQGNVYLICCREEMQSMLGLSDKTVTKAMNDLKKYSLIEEQRRGQGKSNLIYLLTLETLENTKNRKFYDSKNEDFSNQNTEIFRGNNNYINETYISDNDPIQSYPSVLIGTEEKEKTDVIRYDTISNQSVKIENKQKNKESSENATVASDKHSKPSKTFTYSLPELEETIKDNISYDSLTSDYKISLDVADEIVFVMTSTIMTEFSDGYISMGDERVPQELVKSVFFKLTAEHISMFVEDYNKQTTTISKTTPYIRKSLYKSYGGLSHRYSNMVHVDMPQLAKPKLRPNELGK